MGAHFPELPVFRARPEPPLHVGSSRPRGNPVKQDFRVTATHK